MGKAWHLIFKWIPSISIVMFLFFAGEVGVKVWEVPDWLLPAPSSVAYVLYDRAELLAGHTLVTLEEVVIGFLIALCFGFLLASCIVLSNTMEKTLYPIVIASQTVPIIVIAPMLLVWIGYGLAPKVIVVALISFFPVVVNTVDGMKSVDSDLLRLLRTMGAGKWSIYSKIQLPTSMPYLFSGLRVAIAVSVIGAVIGEWVGSSEGLGYLMIRSKPQFQTELVFASIGILSTMGVALFALVVVLERLLLPWCRSEKY